MKILLFMTLLTCLLTGCDRNDTGPSHALEGKWGWKSTCGGVVGCVYASATNYRTLKITDSSLEINDNGNVTLESNYIINKVTNEDNAKLYEIAFSDGTVWTGTVSNNHLTTEYASVIHSVYERLK